MGEGEQIEKEKQLIFKVEELSESLKYHKERLQFNLVRETNQKSHISALIMNNIVTE